MQKIYREFKNCTLCPRECGIDRASGMHGACGESSTLRIARAALHFWEEPPISGISGSGAIFFSGCPLKCIYCQNSEISTDNFGCEITTQRLAKIMLELQEQGANNINLVTPFHFAPQIKDAIDLSRSAGLNLPIVANTSGYESVELIKSMKNYIDIWLTDFKYADNSISFKFSNVKNYIEIALSALLEMKHKLDDKGGYLFKNDIMQQGIIVRHLVIPGHVDDSKRVLDLLAENVGVDIHMSIMNQYTPNAACLKRDDELSKTLSDDKYEEVLDYSDDLGFENVYFQEGGTQSESFIPPFDTTGVIGKEL